MKKSIAAIGLGLLVGGAALMGTGSTAQAAEVHTAAEEMLGGIVAVDEDEASVLTVDAAWKADLKTRIETALRNYEREVDISQLNIDSRSDTSIQAISEVYQEVLDSNPNFFYAVGGYTWYYINGGAITTLKFDFGDYTGANGRIDMNKVNAYWNARDNVYSILEDGMTDMEKLLAIHDYLVLNCSYDYSAKIPETIGDDVTYYGAPFTSYGALVNKSAVGSGYAKAYAELVRALGFQCHMVTSEEMQRAWNMVYVNGAWYHVDVAKDDPKDEAIADYNRLGKVDHTYFLKSDAEMQALGYNGWLLESIYTVGKEAPKATVSDGFQNTIFAAACGEAQLDVVPEKYTNFSYHDGYWYYLSRAEGNDPYADYGDYVITRSKLDGSDVKYWTDEGEFLCLQVVNGRLYYADGVGIYTAVVEDDLKPENILTTVGSKNLINHYFTESVVYGDGSIVAELRNIVDGSYIVQSGNIGARELSPMFRFVTSPTINYTTNPGADKAYVDGVYTVYYQDGTQYAIPNSEIKVFNPDMPEEGTYDVTLEWRGLVKTYQVSQQYDFPVSDVLVSSWQYPGIRYVMDKGYMSSNKTTTEPVRDVFNPEVPLSRGMLVQILYAMEGKPEVEFEETFSDVAEDAWYAEAVMWAYENEITSGYADGRFGSDDPIQRQQAALMLKKYADLKEVDTSDEADLTGFKDETIIEAWAYKAVAWANYHGVISGKGENVDPVGNATRAEMAAMISKFCQNVITVDDNVEE